MRHKILLLLIAAVTVVSCDEFLDREPTTQVSKEQILSDVTGVEFVLAGAYNAMAGGNYYQSSFTVLAELRGGNVKYGKGVTPAVENSYNPAYRFENVYDESSEVNYKFYDSIYEIISAANNVIQAMPNVTDGTEDLRNQLLGEALFIRAICHFDLARLYAQPYVYSASGDHLGIVTLDAPVDVFAQPSRAKLYQTYELIINDLTRASELMGNGRTGTYQVAYASRSAAEALLARVYLYKRDWNNAKLWATKVIDSPLFELAENGDYLAEWAARNPGSEDIFILSQDQNQVVSISKWLGADTQNFDSYTTMSKDLFNLYEPDDVRLGLLHFNPAGFENGVQVYDTLMTKYHSLEQVERYIPILRLSEVYLIRAEAAAEVDDWVTARSDLNAIRLRARPTAETVKTSGEALKTEIFNERRRELAYEGHIFFDLTRRGMDIVREDCNAGANHNITFPDYRLVYPIPEIASRYNENMEQNANY